MALRKNSKQEEEVKEVEVKEETSKPKTSKKEEKVEEVKPLEVRPTQVKQESKKATQPNVRVKPNKDIRTYIGDQWYNLKAGKVETVPKQVKDILAKSGMLDAL
jgi:hypothetical protein